jgi:acetyl esterase
MGHLRQYSFGTRIRKCLGIKKNVKGLKLALSLIHWRLYYQNTSIYRGESMKIKTLNFFSCIVLSAALSTPLFAAVNGSKSGTMPNEEMNQILKELDKKGGKPIENLSVDEARLQPTPTDAVRTVMANSKDANTEFMELAEVKDITVDGGAGLIPARVYKPVTKSKGLLPVVVYYHGGGFVIADNDVYDATPRSLANKTKAIFVSVEYRKGPEHKFPAAHEDAYAAYKWVVNNAASLGGDPKKVAVAGESAGGNLALNVAIKARDEKFQLPIHELLIYPVAGTKMDTASYKKYSEAKPLNKPMMSWFFDNYLNTPAEKNDPRINLVEANLKGLNPCTIITAQIDPLRSEGEELAMKMKKQGVAVRYKNYDGVTHEFFGMGPVLRDARSAQEMASARLKSSFKL